MKYIRETCRIFLLTKRAHRTKRIYHTKIAEAKTKENRSHIYGLEQEMAFETSIYLDEADQIRTRRLYEKARKYDVQIPEGEEFWDVSNSIGGRCLTAKGFNELRSALRKEQNERWLFWEIRLKVVVGVATAIAGAAGALTGLAAILKN